MNKLTLRRMTLLALLTALLTIGRISFAIIPNVQPNTSILIIASFVLGPVQGLILAILSTLTTNLYLGQGLWSIGQMVAWGLIAVMSGYLGKYRHQTPWWILSLYSGLCGFLFGFIISLILGGIVIQKFWPYYLSGLPFDINHAVGNIIFFIVLYKPLMYVMERHLNTGEHKRAA
ncbi:ECF transporter S component [Fictibacillus barbaricus]|uniref:Energy-coupling factor transport system substrate-specific component n=1 Tax=Fictibacillus barbaricus TaxID=182136 RepID=A0ABU1TZE2_9BACL|nr:ECF transporter S component [Fictibacillus barbaricus]MDR7072584.1 energy-coupling factor transport system substrate-specific component [Fictibacillus barbaricus]